MEKLSESLVKYPFTFATPRHRLGGRAIGAVVTCILSPLISIPWNLLAWGRSQTPGMNSLKLRIYSTDTGLPAGRKKIFLRNFCIPLGYLIIPTIYVLLVFGIERNSDRQGLGQIFVGLGYFFFLITYVTDIFLIFKGERHQRLRDIIAHTVILNECIPTESHSDAFSHD